MALGVFAGLAGVALVVRHELAVRAFAPSDRDRSVEWSTALHQWVGAPFMGVGPDRPLVFHAPDGTYAHFVHNEYLQIAADGGTVALALLVFAVVAAVRVVRRADVVSSCATAALLCWAVGGLFDFDWHLTFVAFLGGWCLGLARDDPSKTDGDDARAIARHERGAGPGEREEGGVTIPPRLPGHPTPCVDSGFRAARRIEPFEPKDSQPTDNSSRTRGAAPASALGHRERWHRGARDGDRPTA